MPLPGFDELFARLDAARPEIGVVAAGGADQTVLEALGQAAARGWVRPVLTGSVVEIQALAARLGIDLAAFDCVESSEPAVSAVELIHAGRAKALMKGQIATPDLMKAVLDRSKGLRTERVIGQIVLMELRRDARRLLLTDTGICIDPSYEEKRGLAVQSIELARTLGLAEPSVAFMAATEKENPKLPDTVDSARLASELMSGVFGACKARGPLSFDLAYADEAGQKKKIEGDVVGAADVLVFPNLLSANLTVKAIMYTADCRFGGLLCGTAAPVVFMSRADSTETRMNSLALTLTAFLSKTE
jgi:phosphate butyryltransferase